MNVKTHKMIIHLQEITLILFYSSCKAILKVDFKLLFFSAVNAQIIYS